MLPYTIVNFWYQLTQLWNHHDMVKINNRDLTQKKVEVVNLSDIVEFDPIPEVKFYYLPLNATYTYYFDKLKDGVSVYQARAECKSRKGDLAILEDDITYELIYSAIYLHYYYWIPLPPLDAWVAMNLSSWMGEIKQPYFEQAGGLGHPRSNDGLIYTCLKAGMAGRKDSVSKCTIKMGFICQDVQPDSIKDRLDSSRLFGVSGLPKEIVAKDKFLLIPDRVPQLTAVKLCKIYGMVRMQIENGDFESFKKMNEFLREATKGNPLERPFLSFWMQHRSHHSKEFELKKVGGKGSEKWADSQTNCDARSYTCDCNALIYEETRIVHQNWSIETTKERYAIAIADCDDGRYPLCIKKK